MLIDFMQLVLNYAYAYLQRPATSIVVGISLIIMIFFLFGPYGAKSFRFTVKITINILQKLILIYLALGLLAIWTIPIHLYLLKTYGSPQLRAHYPEWVDAVNYISLLFILVALLIFGLPLLVRPEFTNLQYEKYGRLGMWSRVTRAFNTRKGWTERFSNHCASVISRLTVKGQVISIVGPSANYGDNERLIAYKVADHSKLKVHMQASDYAEVEHLSDFEDDKVRFTYKSQVDARQIQLADAAHAIVDIKGCLWHVASANWFGKKARVEQVLMNYHRILKPNGVVIVDGYKVRTITTLINIILMQFFGFIYGYAEGSTYQSIHNSYKKSKLLQSHFTENIMKDGIYTLVYYQRIDSLEDVSTSEAS